MLLREIIIFVKATPGVTHHRPGLAKRERLCCPLGVQCLTGLLREEEEGVREGITSRWAPYLSAYSSISSAQHTGLT